MMALMGLEKIHILMRLKIGKPIAKKVTETTDYVVSDCVMAGNHIAHIADRKVDSIHPISVLKMAYGL